MTFVDWLFVGLYFLILIWIGFQTMRRIENPDDFAVAGNKIIWPVFFGSLSAAFLGGGASMGLAGQAFSEGYVYLFAFSAYSIQTILVGAFVAPRMKRYRSAHTVGDIMEDHFGRTSRILTGFLSFGLCAGVLGAQALAIGTIFSSTIDLPIELAIVVGMSVVILYSTVGGMWAVIQTDMMQFVLLGVLIPATLIIGISKSGGVTALVDGIPDLHTSFFGDWSAVTFVGLFITFLLGETLIPPYAQRTFSTPDSRHARVGFTLTGFFSLAFYFISASIGLVALYLFPNISPDAAIPKVVMELLPVGLVGLVVAALLAVVMSSASGCVNSTAVVFVRDIYEPFLRSELSARKRLLIERVITVVVGVLATLFAISVPSIVDALLYSYTLWAPTVIIPLIAAIVLGCRSTVAALGAIVLGGLATGIWIALGEPYQLSGVVVGVAVNLCVFALLTLLFSRPSTTGGRPSSQEA